MIPDAEETLKLITITTDFGLQDGYVASMKGVIASIAPDAKTVDITHLIPPQDLREAAYVLKSTVPYFPHGAVHLVVVDPGVGSERRAIAVRTEDAFFVAPDNGVLGYVLEQAEEFEAIHLNNPRYWLDEVSHTFHGRDIFAPVAAHLANGVPLRDLGDPITDIVMLRWPRPKGSVSGCIEGEVVHVDRFGNLVSNIPSKMVERGSWVVKAGKAKIARIESSYSAVQRGEPVALIGSHGFVEVAIREGSAAKMLNLVAGGRIAVCPAE